jgi:hypothetical protein
MNHDSDTEMDILLRRQARRSASGFAGAKPEAASSVTTVTHLDADELSAYAEGALPERARQRYMAHLADCDACRKIVTEIALSSNVEAEEKPVVVQTVSTPLRSWREWLANLFSPPVLRYAAPALALIAFAAIVMVVVTRNRDDASFVARNEQPKTQQQSSNADTKNVNPEPATAPGAAPANSENQGSTLAANANSGAAGRGTTATEAQSPAATDAPPPPSPVDKVNSADASKPADEPMNQQPAITERAQEAKQQGQPEQSAASTNTVEDRNKEKDADTLAAQRRREGEEAAPGNAPAPSAGASGMRAKRSTGAEGGGTVGATNTGSSSDNRKTEATKPASAARARRDSTGDDENESATRMVAGKRFRQQNGVWVDTAYNSSRSTTRVRRGSEQYRSLVADEPVIGSVANAFSGDCIVVVRGRAYYIY